MAANFAKLPRLAERMTTARRPLRAARTTGAVLMEEARALLRQHDMARLAALGFANRDCNGIRVEVLYLEPC